MSQDEKAAELAARNVIRFTRSPWFTLVARTSAIVGAVVATLLATVVTPALMWFFFNNADRITVIEKDRAVRIGTTDARLTKIDANVDDLQADVSAVKSDTQAVKLGMARVEGILEEMQRRDTAQIFTAPPSRPVH